MQIAQVRYFVVSARTLNFTQAARMCGVSQPALSRGVQALERRFGGKLLHRVPTVAVTELGRRVLPFLQQIDEAARLARAAAAVVTSGDLVPVGIGVDAAVSPAMLAGWIETLRRRFAGLSLRLESGEAGVLRQRLMAGELDLLMCGHPGGEAEGPFHRIVLAEEDYVVLHPAGHRFAGAETMPAAVLLGAPDRIRFCETAEALLGQVGTLAAPLHSASHADHFAQLVDAGMGWGLVPAGHVLTAGRHTRAVGAPVIRREVALVYVAGRPHTQGVAGLIRLASRVGGAEARRAGGACA
jgi:DNA-binding transcriptional LysR family regulator